MKAKKQRAKIETANRSPPPPTPHPLGAPIRRTAKLDLSKLLAETPEQCIDSSWENLPPVGRELP